MWASGVSNLVNQNAITVDDETEEFIRSIAQFPKKLQPRPLAATVANVKEQYLLRDNPDTPQNEDLAGQAAVDKAKSDAAATGSGNKSNGKGSVKGDTSGNVNLGTLNGG